MILGDRATATSRQFRQRPREGVAGTHVGRGTGGSDGQISIKLQLDLSIGSRIGPGKIRLLELIESEGSLSRAAQTLGLSYRRAWLFVQQINAAFDEPAIATPEHGRGGTPARLTAFGQELIRRYRRIEWLAEAQGSEDLSWFACHQRE